MWEAITRNRRRSRVLILAMGAVLVALGAAIGMAVDPNFGVAPGAAIALVIWLAMWITALAAGDAMLLGSVGARRIEKADAPRFWNVVEEMTIAAGLAQMPAVYVIEEDAPNAFAVGRKPETAAVAVTSGLLRRLNRDELQGVVAHEIGHVRNLDIRFMTTAAVMMGAITLLADLFLRGLRYGRGGRRRGSGGGGGQAQAILFILAVILAILAPLAARLLYLACSRQREYLADASAARFTRYPAGLASALQKIAGRAASLKAVNRAVAPMYIVNPLQAMAASGMFATHPPTEKRIAVLLAMGGRAGLVDYEAAFRKVEGGSCLGARTLSGEMSLDVRPPSADEAGAGDDPIARSREVLDLLGRMGGLLAIPCTCGLTLKLPPEYTKSTIACPRCGRVHNVPSSSDAGEGRSERTDHPDPHATQGPALYVRTQTGRWESFKCGCGQAIQLSPQFSAARVRCPQCRREIGIAAGEFRRP